MSQEYNIFLLWSAARSKETELRAEIAKQFEIVCSYDISWSDKYFTENLSRFYGKKLPSSRKKMKQCGTGSFLLLLVKGDVSANGCSMSSVKYKLRQMAGGNYLHASDNQAEAEENIYFLLGKSLKQVLRECRKSKTVKLKQDLVGTPTWLDEDKFASAVRQVPDAKLDWKTKTIVCSDYVLAKRLLNARKKRFSLSPCAHKVSIRGRDEIFMIRCP